MGHSEYWTGISGFITVTESTYGAQDIYGSTVVPVYANVRLSPCAIRRKNILGINLHS